MRLAVCLTVALVAIAGCSAAPGRGGPLPLAASDDHLVAGGDTMDAASPKPSPSVCQAQFTPSTCQRFSPSGVDADGCAWTVARNQCRYLPAYADLILTSPQPPPVRPKSDLSAKRP